jgi:regulator of replication initiation timing
MSMSRIFDQYDANNDIGRVTWVDITLAAKVDQLLADVAVLKQHIGELQEELRSMREWNDRLLAHLDMVKETAVP